MTSSAALEEAVDRAWADALGCEVEQLHTPGAHLVPGGPRLLGHDVVYLARVGAATLVYCPQHVREHARSVLAVVPLGWDEHATTAGDDDDRAMCARIAGVRPEEVHGPSWHGFVDAGHLVGGVHARGRRLPPDHPLLTELRHACGDDDWAEGGFFFGDDLEDQALVYGIEEGDRLVAAGNLTPFCGVPADVGLVTRPEARGRGLATSLAARMVADALPQVGIVRYRTLVGNVASLRIARALGFVERGRSHVVRLPR